MNGLLTATSGEIYIDGEPLGVETKKIFCIFSSRENLLDAPTEKLKISFPILQISTIVDSERAYRMLKHLEINPEARLKSLSKGTKEKVQLILVMSRDAALYILDEPIGAVDPAARDYILNTILTNYNENATILLSTHLIHDIENILDRVIFIRKRTYHYQFNGR